MTELAFMPKLNKTTLEPNKVLLDTKRQLLELKKNTRMSFVKKKNKIQALLETTNPLLTQECFNLTQKIAGLYLLADAYSYLTMMYAEADADEVNRNINARKALQETIKCIKIIERISEPETRLERIDFGFIKKCNTHGICYTEDAHNAIKEQLIERYYTP